MNTKAVNSHELISKGQNKTETEKHYMRPREKENDNFIKVDPKIVY